MPICTLFSVSSEARAASGKRHTKVELHAHRVEVVDQAHASRYRWVVEHGPDVHRVYVGLTLSPGGHPTFDTYSSYKGFTTGVQVISL
jgi:hypothetical protein